MSTRSVLRIAVEEYIVLRRRLGIQFLEGARSLRAFVTFAEREGAAA